MTTWDTTYRALPGIPLVKPGDDLAAIIVEAADEDGLTFRDNDVVVVAEEIVPRPKAGSSISMPSHRASAR